MSASRPQGGPAKIVWPDRLGRTPTRKLWFDRIRSLPPGLDLFAIASTFNVGKTTAHTWAKTFGYEIRDDRGSRDRTNRQISFQATAEDGSHHVILVLPGPEPQNAQAAKSKLLLTTQNHRVYRVSKGIYQFVATGQRLISKDTNAP